MEDKIKVSVIIPVYNVVDYFNKCIESIINQTLKEIEIIIVDDGSNDGSSELCDYWSKVDHRIKVIHKINEGQGIARNTALKFATGEYIACVDSDDYIEINTYEYMYNECKQHDFDVAYFNYDRVDINGELVSSSTSYNLETYKGKEKVKTFMLNLVGRIPSEYGRPLTTSASMALYRRQIINENNLLFPDVRYVASEDMLFSLSFLRYANNIGRYPNVFYHYLVNNNSTTTTYHESRYNSFMKCLENVKSICDQNFIIVEYMPHFASQIMRVYKIIIRSEVLVKRPYLQTRAKLKEVCSSHWLSYLYNLDDRVNYPLKDRCLIACMKYNISILLYIAYRYIL